MRVAVSKDYQRKGIGKILIGNIIDEAKKLKYEGVRLVTAIGDYPKYLTEKLNKNFEVIGIDASTNMIKEAKRRSPKAKFYEMDIRNICFEKCYFDCIICFATLIHVNDNDCLNVLDNFDYMLKKNGLIAINVMEYINGEKEIFDKEPFNPKYKTYFNRYKKEFFAEYFTAKNYKVLAFFDNPIFNIEQVKEPSIDTNQFSIIVQKIDKNTNN